MARETLVPTHPTQSLKEVTKRTFDRLRYQDESLSLQEVHDEVNGLFDQAKPELRQFVGPLAENKLLKREP